MRRIGCSGAGMGAGNHQKAPIEGSASRTGWVLGKGQGRERKEGRRLGKERNKVGKCGRTGVLLTDEASPAGGHRVDKVVHGDSQIPL